MAETPSDPSQPDPKTVEIVKQVSPYLRPERKDEATRLIATLVTKFHQGPLPAPEDLAAYNDILPGSAERILTMAEKNLIHRQEHERHWQKAEIEQAGRGQWLAITALLAMLAVIAFALFLGQPWVAGILGGATLVSIVGMFLVQQSHKTPPKPAAPAKKNVPAKRRR